MNRLARFKVLILLLCTLGLLATNVSQAFASNYWVSGKEDHLSGPTNYWTGTHSYNYVMSSPLILDKHVNSVYMRRDEYADGYEGGWWWKKVDGKPRYFAVVVDAGYYYEYPKAWATPGQNNVLFSVQIDNNDNQTARIKRQINGGTVAVMYDSWRDWGEAAQFPEGVLTWGSERNKKNENNYGHFWGLMKKRHDQSWVNWETQGLYGDNDNAGSPVPTSDGYYRREINETDAYSQKEGT